MSNKLISKFLVGMLFTVIAITANAQAVVQEYAQGKVFLSTGMNIEGKNLRISMETVTVNVSGQDQVMALSDVVQIMAKKGKAKKFGKNCAGSCVGFNLGMYLAYGGVGIDENGNEYDVDVAQYFLGAALWGGISYGIGYVAGMVSDEWEVVYLNRG